MISAQFDYAAPAQLDEAVALIAKDESAKVLAGGQSLLLDLRQHKLTPSILVDLRNIRELSRVVYEADVIRVGAMVTCRQISEDAQILENLQALAEAAGQYGDAQTRTRSTLGGNLAQNDPGGDLQAAALVLDAVIHVVGPSGARAIPVESFFVAPYQTDLTDDEIITSVDFPIIGGAGSAYLKFKDPADGSALCGVAACVNPAGSGSCQVAVTGALRTPNRLPGVESGLTGKNITQEKVAARVSEAAAGLQYRGDLHASAEYRQQLMCVLAEQAILLAAERAAVD